MQAWFVQLMQPTNLAYYITGHKSDLGVDMEKAAQAVSPSADYQQASNRADCEGHRRQGYRSHSLAHMAAVASEMKAAPTKTMGIEVSHRIYQRPQWSAKAVDVPRRG
jgi:hypothetical protein